LGDHRYGAFWAATSDYKVLHGYQTRQHIVRQQGMSVVLVMAINASKGWLKHSARSIPFTDNATAKRVL
jgi:hypothetical protein